MMVPRSERALACATGEGRFHVLSRERSPEVLAKPVAAQTGSIPTNAVRSAPNRSPGPSRRRRAGIAAASLAGLLWLPAAWGAAKDGFSVLIIGDSNTEMGYITINLADTLSKYLGTASMGSGYLPIDSGFYPIKTRRYENLSVSYDTAAWKRRDMYEWVRLTPPFRAPNGKWLECSVVNSPATVEFPGNGVDVYWLADTNGGSFTITIDDTLRATVPTAGTISVRKTAITGLATGIHTMRCTATSLNADGRVTLLGFDARNDRAGSLNRSVVHNWGNGWCSSQEFAWIDSSVFVTGLREVAPDVIVVLLGTNDHYIASRSAAEFKSLLITIVNRIKASGVGADVLLVSTFMTNHPSAALFLPQYRTYSFPQAAAETGAQFWDMCEWYGPWTKEMMADDHHCNDAGGKKIANEMLHQILQRFYGVSTVPGQRPDGASRARVEGLAMRVERIGSSVIVRTGSDAPSVVRVRDARGKVIRAWCGSGTCTFDTQDLAAGAYLVSVTAGARSEIIPLPFAGSAR